MERGGGVMETTMCKAETKTTRRTYQTFTSTLVQPHYKVMAPRRRRVQWQYAVKYGIDGLAMGEGVSDETDIAIASC
jgi:hypothetical protein